MKRTMFFIAALLLSPVASAKWLTSDSTDKITGERTVSAFSYIYKQDESIGIRCDVTSDQRQLMLTFDSDSALGTPRTDVDIFVKVDDNQPISFRGRLYTNSYRSGYVRADNKIEADVSKLIAQMLAGNKAYVKIQNDRRSEVVNFSVSLTGFTASSKQTISACGFNPKAKEITPEDKARLSGIELELKKLQSEKDSILSKY
ncbi:hypothetical protein V9J75_000928 [Vibrio fluvialis]|nr:hypothetical protein [Vibrio fluvialis]